MKKYALLRESQCIYPNTGCMGNCGNVIISLIFSNSFTFSIIGKLDKKIKSDN